MRDFSETELREAARALTSLASKLAKVVPRLRKGTAQRTLAARRLKALRIAVVLLKLETGAK